jgi:preprotein translocase subunit SecG
MDFIYYLVVIGFVVIAALLVYFVIVQEPKQTGGDLLGGSSDLFSARGVTGGLYRITVVLGALFAVLALILGRWAR